VLLIATTAVAIGASSPVLLVRDSFDANTPNTFDLNVDIARQTGTLAPLMYSMAFGPGHYAHQLQNANALNQLLLADFPNSTVSLNQNFNNLQSAGGLVISFDVDGMPALYGSTPDNWGAVNLGIAQADQMVNVNGAQTHFGILFRAAGTIQAFDGNAVVSPSPEPIYTSTPGGMHHIDLVITGTDGNPFDGSGNTIIEVFADGGALPVWTFTKVGGYSNNYVNLQGSFRAHFDNFAISRLPADRVPVIANPSFEADNFTTFPGYVSGNGPITGWNALGGHGVNPGTFGGPFTDNGTIPDGTKAGFLQEDGALRQVVSGFTIGATYQIRYFENARNCCSGTAPFVEVRVGGQTVLAAHAVPPVGGANPYRLATTDPFTATATAMELAFVKSNPQGGDTTLLLDNISVLLPNTPPTITRQPENQTIGIGETVSFTVLASGSAPLSYQWFLGNSPIAGATSAEYSFLVEFPDQAGDYHVVVNNSAGSLTSSSATLTVRASVPGLFNTGVDDNKQALPDGAVDPHYTLIVNADSASLDSIVENSAAFPIAGGPWIANTARSKWIGPRFDTSGAAGLASGNGIYVYRITFDLTGLDIDSVVITGNWAIDNDGVSIRVNDIPTGIVNNNGFPTATPFTITSANAALVDAVNTLDFEVRNVDAVAGYTGLYVSNLRGLAALPGTPPSITVQPQSQTVGVGENVVLSAGVAGSSPLSYQWYYNGVPLAGANAVTLTLPGVTHPNDGSYFIIARNSAGSATSSVAVLTVRDVVTTIFNTGVDDNNAALADGAVDSHYKIIVNPDSTSPDAIVHSSTVFPIVAGPWVANTASSKWVGPRLDTASAAGGTGDAGNYVYRIAFGLEGFDPASVVILGNWATDNEGLDIVINGVSTGLRNTAQFASYTPFVISNGFLAGLNTLDFRVNNAAVGWTALRVDGIRGLGTALPAGTSPFIVQQPQDINAVVHDTVTFSVRANGSPPLQYQWYFHDDPLLDQTNQTLSVFLEFEDLAGPYRVEIISPYGFVRSREAFLTIGTTPVIVRQPQSQMVAAGDAVTFSVDARGLEPFSYQWTFNDADIPGAIDRVLTLANVTAANAGSYAVRVSNTGGTTPSAAATLRVGEALRLFNTGVDDASAALPDGSTDPHYTIIVNPDSASGSAIVEDSTVFPIVSGPWVANNDHSKWVGPRMETSGAAGGTGAAGDYVYRTTLDLTGFDPMATLVTGVWATDNEGIDILINGISTGQPNPSQFTVFTPFVINSGFQSGVNTIDFKLNNSALGYTGLRVDQVRAIGLRLPGNQAPSFNWIGGASSLAVQANEDSGPVSAQVAQDISAGPPNESGQTLTFLVSNDQPALFSVQPAISPSGALSFTPAPNANGLAHVTVVLMDDGGTANGGVDRSAPRLLTIQILPENDCPTASGGTVSVSQNSQVQFQLQAADIEDNVFQFQITQPPAHGTLVTQAQTGAASYSPNSGYCGPDTFRYRVSDGQCQSAEATIAINVTCLNRPPVAVAKVEPLFELLGASNLVLSANGSNATVLLDASLSSDPDGDALSYAWSLDPSPVPFATTVEATAELVLGAHRIVLTVRDPSGATGTAAVDVEVITASMALDLITALVDDSDIARKNKRPFIATLKSASAAFDRGNDKAALNMLNAFQNKVRAQLGRTDPDVAAEWIAAVQALIDAVGQ